MIGESIFIGVVGTLLAPAFAILVCMLSLSWSVRDEIENISFTATKNEKLPRCIRDVESKERPRSLAFIYYTYSRTVLHTAMIGFSLAILSCLVAIAPYIILHGDTTNPPEYAFLLQVLSIGLAATTSFLSISRFIAMKVKIRRRKSQF